MNKKNILIIVYRRSAELDWILPILYKLSLEYNIFTFFNNENHEQIIRFNFNKKIYDLNICQL